MQKFCHDSHTQPATGAIFVFTVAFLIGLSPFLSSCVSLIDKTVDPIAFVQEQPPVPGTDRMFDSALQEGTIQPALNVYVRRFEDWQPLQDLIGVTLQSDTMATVSQPVTHAIPADLCPPYDAERQVEYNCAERIETFQLTAGVPGITRDGGSLTIVTAQGNVTLTDYEVASSGRRERYYYLGFLPQLRRHLVAVHLYEGRQHLLVDPETGELTAIPAFPIVNEPGTRFAFVFGPSEFAGPMITIQLWRRDPSAQPAIQPDRIITIPYLDFAYGDLRASWIGEDQLYAHFTDLRHGLTEDIIVKVKANDIDITINGEPANRPALWVDMRLKQDDPMRAIDRVAIGKRLYDDRDYIFTRVPEQLAGQPHFLFDNSNMHETASDYVTFHLYRPATLYIAIDQEACALPGWLADWTPVDITIETTDIAMKLYQKTFPEGGVTLGGNEAPPAACIRSHYLLFVGESKGDLP